MAREAIGVELQPPEFRASAIDTIVKPIEQLESLWSRLRSTTT
ncbi:MAG: hypothetical protein O2782_11110 [bacterium]|nr:hypothetical protein [bacterium]